MNNIDEQDDENIDLQLNLSSRKKKRSKKREIEEDVIEPSHDVGASSSSNTTYSYDFLIRRVYDKLQRNNPELTGETSRVRLQPLDVQREGTRKTAVTNFNHLCTTLRREHEHVMAYILAEFSTTGSIDGTKRLLLRGKFAPASIETVARKYIREYVICDGCKCLQTTIDRDKTSRLLFLRCNQCFASRTVQPITLGFRAKV